MLSCSPQKTQTSDSHNHRRHGYIPSLYWAVLFWKRNQNYMLVCIKSTSWNSNENKTLSCCKKKKTQPSGAHFCDMAVYGHWAIMIIIVIIRIRILINGTYIALYLAQTNQSACIHPILTQSCKPMTINSLNKQILTNKHGTL